MRVPAAPPHPPRARPVAAALAMVLAACAGCAGRAGPPAITPATPPGQSIATGRTFRVICHFPDDAVARQALQLAEIADRVAAALWTPPAPPPRPPLEIHLYKTIQDFDRAAEALTRRTNHDNLNFFLGDRLQAHILVQPLLSDEALAALGLPLLTKSVIAFQAAQLLRAAHGPGWALHPAWYAAGLSKWISLRTLQAVGALGDPMRDPLWSSNVHDVQQLQRRLPAPAPDNTIERAAYWQAGGEAARRRPANTHLPLPSEIMEHDLSGSLTQNEFFGLAWLTFETLLSPRFGVTTRALIARIEDIPSTGLPSPAMAAIARSGQLKPIVDGRVASWAQELFGPETLDAIDADFQTTLTALTPHWSEESRALDTTGSAWRQIAFPPSLRASNHAVAWSLDRVADPAFAISGEALMVPNFGHQMNVFLGLGDTRFLQVSFVADDGVWLLLFDRTRNAWIDRRHMPAAGIAVGAPFAFRVAHAGEIVTVEVGGRLVARLPLDGPADGRWGLGVLEGTAAVWSNVRAAPLPAR